jgi:hypothetical protein
VPTPRTWLARIDEILAILRDTKSDHFDRAALEVLFQIQRRSAYLLMKQVGPVVRGGAQVLERTSLLRWVEHIKETEAYDLSARRQTIEQVVCDLQEKEAMRSARPPTVFPIGREMLRASVASLPESIEIKTGEIRLKFTDPIEALQLLYHLGLALHNDIAPFERSQRSPRLFNYLDIQPDI